MIQLFSEGRESEIIIEVNDPEDPYSGYAVTAKVRAGINTFTGRNDGVQFSKYADFLHDLRAFLATRQGSALLDATEDCWLLFSRWNNKGDVGLKFKVTKYVYFGDTNNMGTVAVVGEFKLDSEYLNQMQEQFEGLEHG